MPKYPQTANPFYELGFYLLPVSFSSAEDAAQKLEALRKGLAGSGDLEGFIRAQLTLLDAAQPYALSLLGASREELLAELERAQESLPGAFESGRDWQTPTGSYFSPTPLGPQARIAFVYPGAFGTYVGMGSQLFRLFPQLSESLDVLTDDPEHAMNAEVIFPQTDDPQVIAALQDTLQRQPTLMISSGIFFSYLFTVILQDIFNIQPSAAFGYSLGENSMMFATGIWTQADAMRTSLEASPIFHERVSGGRTPSANTGCAGQRRIRRRQIHLGELHPDGPRGKSARGHPAGRARLYHPHQHGPPGGDRRRRGGLLACSRVV